MSQPLEIERRVLEEILAAARNTASLLSAALGEIEEDEWPEE
jgi:hypothetical protein